MFAVALVVPLLFQYFKRSGVTSASQREILSSVFSSSQIVGGLLLGALTDARILRRKTVLFISFGGSAVAYALMVTGGFRAMIVSRVIVGLVKQTMTITTSMLAKCTTERNRAKYMGRLQSSATAAWIAGPSAGAMLYKYVDYKAPALVACVLFAINAILAAIFLREIEEDYSTIPSTDSRGKGHGKITSFIQNIKNCFSSVELGSVITCYLLFSFFTRATSYGNMGSYYEDMYGVESHFRGYIQSYQKILSFIIQVALIHPILQRVGGERRAACIGALMIAFATFLESQRSFPIFLVVLSPAISLSTTMMSISLRTLLTQVAPTESIFSVFAAIDVLQNATGVSVPFYRTALFALLNGFSASAGSHSNASMEGDPDPVSWVLSSGLHWCIGAVVMSLLLLRNRPALAKGPLKTA